MEPSMQPSNPSDSFDLSRWEIIGDGLALSRPQAEHPLIRVDRTGPDAWCVEVDRSIRWLARSREECVEWVAESIGPYEEEKVALKARLRSRHGRQQPSVAVPGTILRAIATGDGSTLAISALRFDQVIASSHLEMSLPEARYVLGEPTMCGSSFMKAEWQRQGIGTELYDFAELICGIPRVPHGHNGNGGGQTERARRFWQSRSERRRVPGIPPSPEVGDRREQFELVHDMLGAITNGFDTDFCLALHEITGWQIEVLVNEFGDIRAAWCVMEDGQAFSARGTMQRRVAFNLACEFWKVIPELAAVRPVDPEDLMDGKNLANSLFFPAKGCATERMRNVAEKTLRWHMGATTFGIPAPCL